MIDVLPQRSGEAEVTRREAILERGEAISFSLRLLRVLRISALNDRRIIQ